MPTLETLRIVFMGTPEFAVASLDALVKAGCNIVGVITAPDKPGGRGMLMQQSPVKKYAVENKLHVLQPEKLKNPEFLAELISLHADLQIVVAFRMLPEVVWNMPRMGSVNLHGSLLPHYRGAAPINWAVINGEKETGVTTFKLKQEIDTGDILLQEKLPIGENETVGDVHDRMKDIGAQVLLKTVKGLVDGSLRERPQTSLLYESMVNSACSNNEALKVRGEGSQPSTLKLPVGTLHHAPKISTGTCHIDFTKSVDEVFNLIRGLSPYPAAFTFLQGKKIKLYKVNKIKKAPSIPPGDFDTDGKTFLQFACKDGYTSILDLQLEGKKRMSIGDFLRGYRFG